MIGTEPRCYDSFDNCDVIHSQETSIESVLNNQHTNMWFNDKTFLSERCLRQVCWKHNLGKKRLKTATRSNARSCICLKQSLSFKVYPIECIVPFCSLLFLQTEILIHRFAKINERFVLGLRLAWQPTVRVK